MPDYIVSLESAWIIKDVKSQDDAVSIAISEAGKRLNPAAKFVEIETGAITCPFCEGELNSALVVAQTALVGLMLEIRVFRAESSEHAVRIAKSVVGRALRDVPLRVHEVREAAGTPPGKEEPAREAPKKEGTPAESQRRTSPGREAPKKERASTESQRRTGSGRETPRRGSSAGQAHRRGGPWKDTPKRESSGRNAPRRAPRR
jgi:uncharacterized protein